MTKSYAFKSNRNDPVFFAFDASTGTMARALKGIDEDPDNRTDPKMSAIARALSKLSPEDRDALLDALGSLGQDDTVNKHTGETEHPPYDAAVDTNKPYAAMDRVLRADNRSVAGFHSRFKDAERIGTTPGIAW